MPAIKPKKEIDHRKNNSMNIEQPGQNSVDIAYSSVTAQKRNKNIYHSQ